MYGITYDTWKRTCQMYFELSLGSKKAYLQWFPFSKISEDDAQYITSEEFFEKYIEKSAFVLFPKAMHQSENFLQKGDGSFRDSSLLSPILYLVLQAIGKEISIHYHQKRNFEISTFYAGNYEYMRAKYKQDYDEFYKLINTYISDCQYFIKTDVTSFFPNINLDILINLIDKRCNSEINKFTPTQLKMIKELLLYCGAGRFPTVENSVASSYLATIVYMDEIDERIYQFINKKITDISSFKIIRYVDDMYILINSTCDIVRLHDTYNQIRNEYSSILKEYGLALNTKKCCLKPAIEINDELKKSLYDEYFNGIQHNIEEFFEDRFQKFLESLLQAIKTDYIDVEHYNALIDQHFGSDDIEFTPTEVYNHFIYESENILQDDAVISTICELINTDISFISLDPKRLSIMIMKTKNRLAIKALLNQLFQRNRKGLWNSYDTSIAISYLIQSEFRHIDLLATLNENCADLKNYYDSCCRNSFLTILQSKKVNDYLQIIDKDWKAYFLYFMYWVERKRHNSLAEYAFYKNYFDRFTADLSFFYKCDPNCKKPNYKGFYKENTFQTFYKKIPGSKDIIKQAHELRNANPLSHSSAGLIDKSTSSQDLNKCIEKLNSLIESYIMLHCQ